MDRKTLLAIIKHARKNGWDGKSLSDFKSWCADNLIEDFDDGDGSTFTIKDIEDAWKVKTVTISVAADDGEDVVVEDGTGGGAETEEFDEEDEKAMGEDEEAEKSASRARAEGRRKAARSRDNFRAVKGVHANGSGPAIRTSGVARQKAVYDRAVRDGGKFKGSRPVIGDADRVEGLGAMARLVHFGPWDYANKSNDEAIVKDMGTAQNSTGGALVFGEFVPELIENIEEHGAARAAIGVTEMSEGERTVSRLSDDVTVYDVGEGASITDGTPTLGPVKLIASKTAGLVKASSELVNDSAFDVGVMLGRSIPRAVSKWEDEGVFLGQHNRQGVTDLVGTNTTYDADLASQNSKWSDYTVDDIQALKSLAPAWAIDDPKAGFVCSLNFAMSVFYRFGLDAGGNTGADIAAGFRDRLSFDGFPIYISQIMPKTYSADQVSCLFGGWSTAAKFGVVRGSEQMATSDQRYFDTDQIAFRYTQRWGHTLHDVNDTANESGIVALQD